MRVKGMENADFAVFLLMIFHCLFCFGFIGTIAQLEKSVKTARAGSTITGVPPPRPSITAPVGNSNNSNNGEENEAERRASVNFSARDLTLLRQKKKQEEAAAAKARYCSVCVHAGMTIPLPATHVMIFSPMFDLFSPLLFCMWCTQFGSTRSGPDARAGSFLCS